MSLDSVKLIEHLFSAVSVVSTNPCVGPSPKIKISFFLLSLCTENSYLLQKLLHFYQIH